MMIALNSTKVKEVNSLLFAPPSNTIPTVKDMVWIVLVLDLQKFIVILTKKGLLPVRLPVVSLIEIRSSIWALIA